MMVSKALPAPAPVAVPQVRRLRWPWPLLVRYATCVGEDGRPRFLPDVYGRNEDLRQTRFGADGRH